MAAMARKLRVLFEGAIYHVTVRGVERRRLVRHDADRERFVTRLGDAADEYGVRVSRLAQNGNDVSSVWHWGLNQELRNSGIAGDRFFVSS